MSFMDGQNAYTTVNAPLKQYRNFQLSKIMLVIQNEGKVPTVSTVNTPPESLGETMRLLSLDKAVPIHSIS